MFLQIANPKSAVFLRPEVYTPEARGPLISILRRQSDPRTDKALFTGILLRHTACIGEKRGA